MLSALAILRAAHFLSLMIAFGASAFLWLYAPKGLERALAPRIWRLVAALSVIAALSAVGWLAMEAASMSGAWGGALDPQTLRDVLADTGFGAVWRARLVLAALLLAWVAFGRGRSWPTTAILCGALLASLGLVGHAAMQTGALGAAHRANHALHLITTGAWLGGLIPFALALRCCADATLRGEAATAMRRFSAWGRLVVLLVVATGMANIALIPGVSALPPLTAYRALLDTKLVLVAAMIALALVNRHVLTPRLAPGGPAQRALLVTSLVEVALGVAVVMLVSVFALLDPSPGR
jgi:putative copper resistance protein D